MSFLASIPATLILVVLVIALSWRCAVLAKRNWELSGTLADIRQRIVSKRVGVQEFAGVVQRQRAAAKWEDGGPCG